MHQCRRGLDKHGFIDNVCSVNSIQREFKMVVDQVVSQLVQRLPKQVDSIYLYGSVARGEAVIGCSDLDLSILLNTPLTAHHQQVFNEISASIPQTYSEISKLDIDPGYLYDVLKPREVYHWHFWLKHCCCCVWGKDHSVHFPRHKPSLAIAQAINGDLCNYLLKMQPEFASMSDINVAKIIGKKLLRSAYYYVAEQDGSWYINLTQCAAVAKEYYPYHGADLDLAYQYAVGELTSKSGAIELFQRLSAEIFAPQKVNNSVS